GPVFAGATEKFCGDMELQSQEAGSAMTPAPTAAADAAPVPASRLVENLMFFGRTLRAAGLPIGPGRVIEALGAVQTVGIGRRDDFYWTLHAVFVNRQDQRPLFDQAFHVFWRNPQLLERMMAMLLPSLTPGGEPDKGEELARRLADALRAEKPNGL